VPSLCDATEKKYLFKYNEMAELPLAALCLIRLANIADDDVLAAVAGIHRHLFF